MSLRAAQALTVIKEDGEWACYGSLLYKGSIGSQHVTALWLPTMGPDGRLAIPLRVKHLISALYIIIAAIYYATDWR